MDTIKIPAPGMEGCVHSVRGKLVMIDRDLAACFGLETRVFNQSFKRKLQLFDAECVFQLSKEELLTSQIVISSWGGSRHLPYAFTEDGVRVLARMLKRQVEVDFASGYGGGGLLPKPWSEGTVVLYQPDEETSIEVRVYDDTVWLTQEQMAVLFLATKQNISFHIRNVFLEKELEKWATVKEYLTVQTEGGLKKSRNILYYNLDVIISVGYRVKSARGTKFRQWAIRELKNILLKRHYNDSRIDRLEEHSRVTDNRLDRIESQVEFMVHTNLPPVEGIFYDGQVFDAFKFVCDLIRTARRRIVLIDNYVDDSVLTLLDKRDANVSASILTKSISHTLQLDLERHNAQYPAVEVQQFSRSHDRFLCIDDTVYHIGASLKDLGKKWFAFSRMEISADELISHIKETSINTN